MAGELAEEAWDSGLLYDDYDSFDETTEWQMKNRTVIKIKDMEISHIENVVKMLKGKGMYVPKEMIKMIRKAK